MTQIARRIRRAIKFIAVGGTPIPQRFFLGQQSPQTEISVWLYGMASPLDVTDRHSMACAIPFTLCLALDKDQIPNKKETERLTLKFCERDGNKRVLGTIGLKLVERISLNGRDFFLFQARSATNYCVPRLRLWAHYLLYEYAERRSSYIPDVKLSFLEKRAMGVMFICPRPISLVSVLTDIKGNMFPMNVMGDIDNGYFAFALRGTKIPAHLVEESRRIALSSVPFQQGAIAYQLGVNHNKQSIDWYELPFETRKSKTFQIPVPVFAYRLREMEVETIHRIGSHTFFIARIVSDELNSTGDELFVIHGFYEAWRIKKNHGEWSSALADDARIKAGASYKSSPV
jgi:flavin reductase (DIM6/NTAB) family NADH-FMN oxidoreductase RutF